MTKDMVLHMFSLWSLRVFSFRSSFDFGATRRTEAGNVLHAVRPELVEERSRRIERCALLSRLGAECSHPERAQHKKSYFQ